MTDIKEKIVSIAKSKGVMMKEIAERMGITDIALHKSLRGSPNLKTLTAIADILDVPVWRLFTESTDTRDFMALVKSGNDFRHATSLEELEKIVEDLKSGKNENQE